MSDALPSSVAEPLERYVSAAGERLGARRVTAAMCVLEWLRVTRTLGPSALLELAARQALTTALRLEAEALRRAADAADELRQAVEQLPPQGGPRA